MFFILYIFFKVALNLSINDKSNEPLVPSCIFSNFITNNSLGIIKWIYGLEIVLGVGLWFIILSIVISNKYFNIYYKKYIKVFDIIFSTLLLYFSIKIIISVLS